MATGGDHFGAMGPLWWVLNCLWGPFGVLLARLWGPKRRQGKPQDGSEGHLGVHWASGRVPGSFWGCLCRRKNDILRSQNLAISLAGPIEIQYFGFSTLGTKMTDLGFILGGWGVQRRRPEWELWSQTIPPIPILHTLVLRYFGTSVHRSIDVLTYR